MKKSKYLFLTALFAICTFVLLGVGQVKAAYVGFTLQSPACDPNEGLLPGETSTCYIAGTSSQSGPAHGFIANVYTTDGLRYVKAYKYPSTSGNVDVLELEASAASSTKKGTLTYTSGSEEFTCRYDTNVKAEKTAWQIEDGDDFRCVVWYSKGENFYNGVNNAPTDSIKELTGDGNGMIVLGSIEVKVDDSIENQSSCGELCIAVKEMEESGNYASFDETLGTYKCTEVHYTAGSPAAADDQPDTGAFTSYLLLAAGAFVAISAVTIAKKHNKFYRV